MRAIQPVTRAKRSQPYPINQVIPTISLKNEKEFVRLVSAVRHSAGLGCGPRKSHRFLGQCLFAYQITFRASWIWRDVVWVEVIRPALATGLPLWSKTERLLVGEAKLV